VEWGGVETELVTLINDDEPANRLRSIAVLGVFPEIISRLEQTALTALHHTVANDALLPATPHAFTAAETDEFRDGLVERFKALDDAAAARVLSATAPPSLWPDALSRYDASGSFRGAEARFDQFISPFRPIIDEIQLDEQFAAARDNGQIWDAARTPTQLADLLRATHPHRPSSETIDRLMTACRTTRSVTIPIFGQSWNNAAGRGPPPDQHGASVSYQRPSALRYSRAQLLRR
jgi:hypothetical protein